MSQHTFYTKWNYCQYKRANTNLFLGYILLVHDSAQNILYIRQNESQALDWVYQQVTVLPSVAHFICPKARCDKVVTHEMLCVSDDLKHSAHLVNKFTQVTVDVLKKKKVNICKIVEFTDQAPSQYKNKTALRYLGQSKIPTMRNFYAVRHGKALVMPAQEE